MTVACLSVSWTASDDTHYARNHSCLFLFLFYSRPTGEWWSMMQAASKFARQALLRTDAPIGSARVTQAVAILHRDYMRVAACTVWYVML